MGGESLFQIWVLNGGVIMFVLIPCAVWMVAEMIQRLFILRYSRILPGHLARRAAGVRGPEGRAEFLHAIEKENNALAQSVALALNRIGPRSESLPTAQDTQAIIADSVAFAADELYDKLSVFSVLYTIGPLLGLLGTVLGMVNAFMAFGTGDQPDQTSLIKGIQNALVSTAWGLALAIPSYIAAEAFQARIRHYERIDLPEEAGRILRTIYSDEPPSPSAETVAQPGDRSAGEGSATL